MGISVDKREEEEEEDASQRQHVANGSSRHFTGLREKGTEVDEGLKMTKKFEDNDVWPKEWISQTSPLLLRHGLGVIKMGNSPFGMISIR